MGEFVAWIIGWDLVFMLLGAATVAVSWSIIDKFLANYGIHIPQSISAWSLGHKTNY
jgi:hypothetical protein